MVDEGKLDNSSNNPRGHPSIEVSGWSRGLMPPYLKDFLDSSGVNISKSLDTNNKQDLEGLLEQFATTLPKDEFKEVAVLVCRRQNGNLYVSTVEGNMDEIEAEESRILLDDLVQSVPLDTEQVLFLHTHPPQKTPIGLVPHNQDEVGFSSADRHFFKLLGGKLRIIDLKNAYLGLATANTRHVVLEEGKFQGKAFGWTFDDDDTIDTDPLCRHNQKSSQMLCLEIFLPQVLH